jgi:hypothetical protein
MATRISKNFTLEELLSSEVAKSRGIANIPTHEVIVNLCALVHHVLQPMRDGLNEPIVISSGFRCPKLNAAVGGVSNSQHLKGEAADPFINGDMNKGRRWFTWIKAHCQFDQLIWEHSAKGTYWVHVSYRADGNNRKKVIENLLKR